MSTVDPLSQRLGLKHRRIENTKSFRDGSLPFDKANYALQLPERSGIRFVIGRRGRKAFSAGSVRTIKRPSRRLEFEASFKMQNTFMQDDLLNRKSGTDLSVVQLYIHARVLSSLQSVRVRIINHHHPANACDL